MEENTNYERDLASIRNIMERSVKFISLSGLAGVLAGVIALLSATYAYQMLYSDGTFYDASRVEIGADIKIKFILLGLATLIVSVAIGLYMSFRKAKKLGVSFWNATSKRLVINLAIPLGAGGAFVLALMWHGFVGHVAPACLIFYGLALVNASQNLYDEIRYLGYCELFLGILAAFVIGYGLVFWAIGFGVLHIVYGVLMYRKYDA
jgi:hypothetical protein